MTIRAGIVSVALIAAVVALLQMATKNSSAADLDRSHDAMLRHGHRSAILQAIICAVAAEYADSLRDTQSGSVADGQNRAMLDTPHRAQKLQNFFRAQDNRQLLGHLGRWNDFFQAPVLTKCDFVEKTKGRYGDDNRARSELSFVL
jgi:hypothetical protein